MSPLWESALPASPPVAAGRTTGSIAVFLANCRFSACASKRGAPLLPGMAGTLAVKKVLTEAPCGSVAVTSTVKSVCLYAARAYTNILLPSGCAKGMSVPRRTFSGRSPRTCAVMVRVSPSGSLNMEE